MIPRFATIDFETEAIVGNPTLKPPRHVGVAVEVPGELPPVYLAWGHPTNNNATLQDGCALLDKILSSGIDLLFHHANFDLSVWESMHPYFRNLIAKMNWRRVHDTEYLIFFNDPYSNNLSLKPSAERILGLPPTEQNELKQWILANVPGATAGDFGAYISKAPGDLVGRYAKGDIVRTTALFTKLHARIAELEMLPAYDRERRLAPITRAATRHGIRLNRAALEADTELYTRALLHTEDRLMQALRINTLEDEETFKDGLERAGAVTKWVRTPKSGKRSLSADNLEIVIPEIRQLMDYRGALKTCLQSFMRPWLGFSREDGRIHPNWNQVRQRGEDFKGKGARTGRVSSDSPAFMNVPTEWEYADGSPMQAPPGLPPYPVIRKYCLPDEGHLWLKRDFNSQEFRVLAHHENGLIAEAYRKDPNMDPHQLGSDMFRDVAGIQLARKPVKSTGFSIIYGSGYPGIQRKLKVEYDRAKLIKDTYLHVFPGVKDFMDECQDAGRSGVGVRTWGGRLYLAEPSKITYIDSDFGCKLEKRQDFYYKLCNYRVQGGAADQTKECINDWDDTRDPDSVFLATVHDELDISAPAEKAVEAMQHLKLIMDKDRLSVPVRSEGLVGMNWAEMHKCF